MRGVYECQYQFTSTISAGQTLMYWLTPLNNPVEVVEAHVTIKDLATNQQLECAIQRVTTIGSPGSPTAVTPNPTEFYDQAASTVVKANPSSEPTTYTSGNVYGLEGWASLAGWHYQPIEKSRPFLQINSYYGLRLLSGSFTACKPDVRIVFREIG